MPAPDRRQETSHDRVAAIAVRVQAHLDAALACDDVARGRELLPPALRALSVASQQLVGGGLVPGSEWFDAAHRQVSARAVVLFGLGQRVIEPCHVEPMPRPTGAPCQLRPRH